MKKYATMEENLRKSDLFDNVTRDMDEEMKKRVYQKLIEIMGNRDVVWLECSYQKFYSTLLEIVKNK